MEAAKAAVPTLAARVFAGRAGSPNCGDGRCDRPHHPDAQQAVRRLRDVAHDRRVPDPAGLVITTAGLSSVILVSHDRRLMRL